MPALAGQLHLNGTHLGGGNQSPMMPRVSGLGAGFAPALALSPSRPLVAGESVGGRWFRGIGRILFPQRQLPLQIGDLLFSVGDLLLRVGNLLLRVRNLLGAFDNLSFALGYLTAEFFVLAVEPLIIPVQFRPARLVRMPIAIRRCLLSSCEASCPRTHPPYVKRFPVICPAKSRLVRELLPSASITWPTRQNPITAHVARMSRRNSPSGKLFAIASCVENQALEAVSQEQPAPVRLSLRNKRQKHVPHVRCDSVCL